MLEQMVKKKTAKRWDLETVIMALEQIILERLQKNYDAAIQSNISIGYGLGIHARLQLESLANREPAINPKNSAALVRVLNRRSNQ